MAHADEEDHERARKALQAREVLPLKTIMIVEDEPTLQSQLAQSARESGHAVDVASNGVDGHFQGDTEPYDAVVLDLGLPQMDGITVLRKWRAAGRTMPKVDLRPAMRALSGCSASGFGKPR